MTKKILLVEDEAILAMSEAKMLEKHNYEVVTVYSGEKAIEVVDSDPEISLILMDIDLGKGMDGTEASQKILEKHDIPIAFLSSHTEPEVVEKTEGITSYGYLVKNSGETVILASIKMAFRLFDAKMKEKEKERQLRESKERFKRIFETEDVAIALSRLEDGVYIEANPAFEKVTGYSYNEIVGHSSRELLFMSSSYRENMAAQLRTYGELKNQKLTFPTKQGEMRTILFSISTITLNEQDCLLAVMSDITERNKQEDMLKSSEKKYQLLFNYSNDAIFVHEIGEDKLPGRIIEANEQACKLLKYGKEELLKLSVIDIAPEKNHFLILSLSKELVKKKHLTFETENVRSDNIVIPVEVSAYSYHEDGKEFVLSSVRDITERKQAEEKLRASENKYRNMIEGIHDSIYRMSLPDGSYQYLSPATEKVFGYPVKEFINNLYFIQKIIHPDSAGYFKEKWEELLEGSVPETYEYKIIDSEGNERWIMQSNKAIFDDSGSITAIEGLCRNVTERKQAENALLEKTEMLNNVIENISDLVLMADVSGYITYHSDLYETLGYGQNSLIGRNVLEFVHPEDLSEIESNFTEFINNREDKRRVEYRFRCANGNYVWLETDGKTIKDEEGNIKEVIFSARDITDRKKANDAIRESEEKYRLITENASDIIVQVDEQLKPTYISPSVAETLGYTIEEIDDANILEFVPPEDQKSLAELIEENINKNMKKLTLSHRVYTKSGEIRWMETRASLSYDDKGHFNGATYAHRDITDIRKLEQLIQERRQLLEAILEATPNAIIAFDSRNTINEWNRGAEKLFHYRKEEVLGQDIDEIVGGEDDIVYEEALSFSQQTLSGEAVPPTQTVRFTKEGEPLSVIVAGSPIMVDGTFTGVVATYTDISQLKQKEKEVEMLLEQKEHLLHEVHHRIKNHMSTISSIISLRASHIDKPQIREVLEEVQDKVNLMQNIYQHLYTGEDVGTIRISSYLGPVLHDIRYAYIDNRSISISTDIEEIEVTSKQSFPIGIIITELITNSIKYAFDESGEGKIHIAIHKDKENTNFLCIEVSDNGKGMPSEIVENGEYGFGLTLVEGYTKQFDGTMSISTKEGTTVRVVLELE